MKNGEFDNVLSEVIEDSKITRSLKLRGVYEADTTAALNSGVLLELSLIHISEPTRPY